jgi:hypothetical protein
MEVSQILKKKIAKEVLIFSSLIIIAVCVWGFFKIQLSLYKIENIQFNQELEKLILKRDSIDRLTKDRVPTWEESEPIGKILDLPSLEELNLESQKSKKEVGKQKPSYKKNTPSDKIEIPISHNDQAELDSLNKKWDLTGIRPINEDVSTSDTIKTKTLDSLILEIKKTKLEQNNLLIKSKSKSIQLDKLPQTIIIVILGIYFLRIFVAIIIWAFKTLRDEQNV